MRIIIVEPGPPVIGRGCGLHTDMASPSVKRTSSRGNENFNGAAIIETRKAQREPIAAMLEVERFTLAPV
jgi:hypothetical protein